MPGVDDTTTSPITTRGADINSTVYPDNVELIYLREWGDCPAGCMFHRYWKFNVYYNCDVEFVSSYGDPLVPTGITITKPEKFSVYPNPFTNEICIKGFSASFAFSISDLAGRVVITGQSDNNKVVVPSSLSPGMYLLHLKTAEQRTTLKIWKE